MKTRSGKYVDVGSGPVRSAERRSESPSPQAPFRLASFFSGIGGFDLGFRRAGFEVVYQYELNKSC